MPGQGRPPAVTKAARAQRLGTSQHRREPTRRAGGFMDLPHQATGRRALRDPVTPSTDVGARPRRPPRPSSTASLARAGSPLPLLPCPGPHGVAPGREGDPKRSGVRKENRTVGLCRFAFAVAELREHSSRSHRDHSPGRTRQFRGVTGRIVSPKTHVLRSQLPGLRKRLCSERRPLKR